MPTPDNFFITDNDNEEKPNNDKESANLPSTSGTSREDTKEMPHSDDDSDSESINLREYGILSRHQKIEVDLRKEIKKVKETEANAAIIENARDLFRILNNHHLPSVKKWIQVISKATGVYCNYNCSRLIKMIKSLLCRPMAYS